MAFILKGKSNASLLIANESGVVDSRFYVKKIYAHVSPVDAPYVADINSITNPLIIDAISYFVSDKKIGVAATASLQSPVSYSRIYLVNNSDEIIYAFDIIEETQSEVSIDALINLSDATAIDETFTTATFET